MIRMRETGMGLPYSVQNATVEKSRFSGYFDEYRQLGNIRCH